MSMLVKFEDTYGMCDLVLYSFGIEFLPRKVMDKTLVIDENPVLICRGLGSLSVFKPDTITKSYDTIVIVYDMDKLNTRSKLNYAKAIDFEEATKELRKLECSCKIFYVPVTFAFETIMLHKLDPLSIDFSLRYSDKNTAHMHSNLLGDLESQIHTDKTDRTYWREIANKGPVFKIKEACSYVSDGNSILHTISMLEHKEYSVLNRHLLNWIKSGSILDTSSLLNYSEAYELHKLFEDTISEKLAVHDTGIVYDGKHYT